MPAFQLPQSPITWTAGEVFVCMGSCFAQHVQTWLQQRDGVVHAHTLGTLYHPLAIASWLQLSAAFLERPDLYVQADGMPAHLMAGKPKQDFENAAALKQHLVQQHEALQSVLATAQHLVLTFGTAHAWQWQAEPAQPIWVANCQKQPQAMFHRQLLSVQAMTTVLWFALAPLLERNPQLQVWLTVSPVRHTKEGLAANGMSKASLRVLCQQLEGQEPTRVHYLPIYELFIDHLRDYSWYGLDGIHPNSQALDWVQGWLWASEK